MAILAVIDGYKTYISAFCLLILGIFQITNGNVVAGIQTLLSAAAAAGLRHAVSKK